jgi:kynurenine formamidase
MVINFSINEETYSADISQPVDISIPLIFNGEQPNTYDVPKAKAQAYEQGDFIGDVKRGGGCNFERYTLIPHCNGTHTECVGHISYERISINNTFKEALIPATLITVKPVISGKTDDRYIPDKGTEDMLITRLSLEEALANGDSAFMKALIIRTFPNNISKKSRKYMENHPPFFSLDAMEFIVELGVEHLLIDIPSVDRTFDEGKLTTHHIFWEVEKESHDIDTENHSMKTITEMIYVPDDAEDGEYLVNIQIPNFTSDAAPSRVLVYQVSSL